MNLFKTHIQTSVDGHSAIPPITSVDPNLSTTVYNAIKTYSANPRVVEGDDPVPVEVTDGFCLWLGTPVDWQLCITLLQILLRHQNVCDRSALLAANMLLDSPPFVCIMHHKKTPTPARSRCPLTHAY